jgi:lipoprotein signal peptidase
MKIDWKRKLSSRKFWAAIAAFISAHGAAFGLAENTTARVICIVSGIGALCVYMLAEAKADAAANAAPSPASDTENTDSKPP